MNFWPNVLKTPIQAKSRLLSDENAASETSEPIEMGSDASSTPKEPQESAAPQTEEDAAFADVLNTLDEFLQSDDKKGT
ncbi:hypothetical protein QTO30_05650 [Yoonia sp. GPGPB17]|uniref:hypothetical protein n=1 Tax=Yoonia sp. GPGPB17 TaxID=3026147 RepID=UPI0030C0E07F